MPKALRLAAGALAVCAGAAAQTDSTAALIQRLTGPSSRLEADLRVLTDEIGGRVTGSEGYERALRWGIDAFHRAGVDSVRLESYPAPAKWEAVSASASVIEPWEFSVRVASYALAPSTSGPLIAPLVDAGHGREADFEKLGALVRGAVVLVQTDPMLSFEDLFAEYLAAPDIMHAAVARGAAAIVFQSTRPRGLLYRHTITWGPIAPIPMAQIGREDGLRLARLMAAGRALKIRLDLQNRVGGAWQPSNVVAEIRGTETPEEIVLLGAHLDSWDLGTGALDNGVNCALVVDVARAIAAGPRPKRTIRFVLFTSEETGLLGSLGYVRAHRDEMSRHVAAVIHDIGDGKIVGYFTNGRPELDAPLKTILAPVASLGAAGTKDEALLGTDNFDFLLEGVPNLVADQETARYLADYHAASDTFDKIDADLARQNAAVAAVAVLGIANARSRLGPRQDRAQVQGVLEAGKLDAQMKTYGLWSDWETGKRGREK
ncbi:MAG: M28 family peptidase [Acidobacteriota bacterium]